MQIYHFSFVCPSVNRSAHLPVDTSVVSKLWPLWSVLQEIHECWYFLSTLVSFPLHVYLIEGFQGSMAVLWVFLIYLKKMYNGCVRLHSHQQCMGLPVSLCPFRHLLSGNSHSSWAQVVFHCCLGVHFCDGQCSWEFLHIIAGCWYILFWEMSSQVNCLF